MASLDPILAMMRMFLGAAHHINICSVIFGSVIVSTFSWSGWSSPSLSHNRVLLPSYPSNIKMWGSRHLCPAVNRSLQLKHKLWARLLYISSQVRCWIGVVGIVGAARLKLRGEIIDLIGGDGVGLLNLLCLLSWSSFIRARLMASFNVCGLNMHIPSEISVFKPPINVPTRAFCVHPRTWLLIRSNSRWYSRSEPHCLILERALSKSSHSEGPKRAQSSSSKFSHDKTRPSSSINRRTHFHHRLASLSKW